MRLQIASLYHFFLSSRRDIGIASGFGLFVFDRVRDALVQTRFHDSSLITFSS